MKIYFNISSYPYESLLSKGIRLSGQELRILSWKGKRCFVSRAEAHKVKENTFYEGDIVEFDNEFIIKNIEEQKPLQLFERGVTINSVAQFPEIKEIRAQYLLSKKYITETEAFHANYGYKLGSNYISKEVQEFADSFSIDLNSLIRAAGEAGLVINWLEAPTLREFNVWTRGNRVDQFHILAVYSRAGLDVSFRQAEGSRPAQHLISCRYAEHKKVSVMSYRLMTLEERHEFNVAENVSCDDTIVIDIVCDGIKYILYVKTYFDSMDEWVHEVLKFVKR